MKIVVAGRFDYIKYCWEEDIKEKKILYFDNDSIRRQTLKNRLYNKRDLLIGRLFKNKENICKCKIALREFFDIDSLKKNDEIIFIIYEMNFISTDVFLLKTLKDYYPKIRFVLFFSNVIGSVRPNQTKMLIDNISFFDLVYTFNLKDSEKYGLLLFFNGAFPYNSKIKEKQTISRYDVLWVGKNKKRFKTIEKIRDSFNDKNINSFFVIYDDDNLCKNYDNIKVINKPMQYIETVNYICKSKYILDYSDNDTVTIRLTEAIANKKGLITNNHAIKKYYQDAFDSGQFVFLEDINDVADLSGNFKPIDPYNVSTKAFIEDVVCRIKESKWRKNGRL